MEMTRARGGLSDKKINRLIVGIVVALAIGIPAIGLIYFMDRWVDPGPTLIQRQVARAEEAVQKEPNNVGVRLVLATSYIAAARPDDAISQYDQILAVAPSHRGALLGKGDALVSKGDLDAAKIPYQKLVDDAKGGEFAMADTQLEAAYYSLGSIAMQQGRPADAVTNLEAALKIMGADSDAWNLLGAAQLSLGAPDKAVAALRSAILFVPTGWSEPYATLAKAYQAAGKTVEAEYAAAMVDFNENRSTQAKQRLTALTSGPVATDAMLGLALITEADGERDAAADWYRKVLAADPTNFTAQVGLSRVTDPSPGGAHPSIPPQSPAAGGNG